MKNFDLKSNSEITKIVHEYGEKIILKKGDVIITPFSEDVHAYYIEQGFFSFILSNEDGENKILKIEEQGDFIALVPVLIPSYEINVYITAVTYAIVYRMDKATINLLLNSSIVFRDYVIQYLSKNAHNNMEHSILLTLKSNKQKIYNFLLNYVDFENLLDDGWYTLKHNYKQQEIADFTGINRITVWKAMNELIEEGVVRTINNKIQVKLDLDSSIK